MTFEHASADSRVIVIGAGIVGLLTALEIQRTGRNVVVIEQAAPGGRQAASYGNGAWVAGGIMPVSEPSLWRKIPGFLLDRAGPFVIRWRHLPQLLPWLVRFLWAGRSWLQVAKCARTRFELSRDSTEAHKLIAAEAGVSDLVEHLGAITLYTSKENFLNDAAWKMRISLGVKVVELNADALRKIEPNISDRYQFGILLNDTAHVTNLAAYCQAIAELIKARGGQFIQGRATGFTMDGNDLSAVNLEGSSIRCHQAVVTAGIGSRELAADVGDRIPLVSERGYHVVIPAPSKLLTHPIAPSDASLVITPTQQGLRVAGQVELASVDAAPDWQRAEILRGWFKKVFPGMDVSDEVSDRWMGHRPSTPDGLPVLGTSPSCHGLFYGFGHGHAGVIHAPATAKALARIIRGQKASFDISPMRADRF